MSTPQHDESTDRDRHARHAWRVVARREILSKLTDKAFVFGTLLTLVVLVGFLGWQAWSEERTQDYTVVATSADLPVAEMVAERVPDVDDGIRVEVEEVDDDAAGVDAVRADDADALLRPTDAGFELVAHEEVPDGLLSATEDVIRQSVLTRNAEAAGTTLDALSEGSTVEPVLLEGDAQQQLFAQVAGFIMAFLFYMTALTFGFTLAGSVVEEKSSRIVEIIASKIPIRQLLIGKVLGNSALAVGQTVLIVTVGLVGASFTQYSSYLPGASAGLAWFAAFFLVGFLLIACWWAVAGALASRSEDLQSTATPLTFLMMAVFFGSFLFKGTALTVASYVPPFSTLLMPIRILQGETAWWEPVVALVVLLAAAGATVMLAERLYRRALLQTQGRVSIRQAWSTAE